MSYNVYHKTVGKPAPYTWGTYGVELEAERLDREQAALLGAGELFTEPALQRLQRTSWRAVADGSLRHNGVEFVSAPQTVPALRHGLRDLYEAMDAGLFAPSVRTGIHIHANVSTLLAPELLERMRAYAVLEPLLFRFVGPEREQNIYCVPLYRAANEQRNWLALAALLAEPFVNRQVQARLITVMRSFCKYAALNFESFLRFGTVEFRHAPTFETYAEMDRWLTLVDAVMHFTLPAPATLASLEGFRAAAMLAMPQLNWREYLAEVEQRDLLGFADSLLPFTYKVGEWGAPASMAFDAAVPPPRAPRAEPEVIRQRTPEEQMVYLQELMRTSRFAMEPRDLTLDMNEEEG